MKPLTLAPFLALFAGSSALAAPPQGTLNHFGLDHTPLGQATLSTDPVSGKLKISNLGSSGQDGVSIASGGGEGWSAFNPPMAGQDWTLEYVAQGSGPNTQVMDMLGARITDALGRKTLEVGFEGVSTVSIEAYLGGHLTHNATGHSDDYIYIPITEYVPHHTCINVYYYQYQEVPPYWGWVVEFTWQPSNPPVHTFPGGVQAPADVVIVRPENPSIVFDLMEGMRVMGTDTPDIEFTGERVRMFQAAFEAVDLARLEPTGGNKLKISNLGSSGCDGVSIHPGPTETIVAKMQRLDPLFSAPGGSFIEASAVGTVNGMPDRSLGSSRTTKLGQGSHEITADFSPIGASTHRILLYDGPNLVVDFPAQSGVVANADDFPTDFGKLSGAYPCFVYCWPDITVFQIAGGNYQGTELRILAETQAIVDEQSRMDLVTKDLPEMVLTGLDLEPVPPITVYCTAKSGLVCGIPAIDATGEPRASASSGFTVTAAPARSNKSGLLFYSNAGRAALPFHNGLLCVSTPLRRTVPVSSGGTNGPCDGVFALDMNAFAHGLLGGNPTAYLLVPGTQLNVQWWGRDSQATGSFLSDAAEYEIRP